MVLRISTSDAAMRSPSEPDASPESRPVLEVTDASTAAVDEAAGAAVDEPAGAPEHEPVPGASRTLRSILVAAAAHELRSTLSLVSGYSQSLQYLGLDAATRRQYLERIISAATTLTECADELVELADDERPPLQREPMAVAWLVERANRELASDGAGALECSVEPGLPLVEVDPTWILHVLRNLIANARRHGSAGTVRIRARAAGDAVVVSVVDSGPGIDPADRPHVFEPFYRGVQARTSGTPGSGIGLYVCRRLVEAQGGEIWLDDTETGTSISFSLPLWRASAARASALHASPAGT